MWHKALLLIFLLSASPSFAENSDQSFNVGASTAVAGEAAEVAHLPKVHGIAVITGNINSAVQFQNAINERDLGEASGVFVGQFTETRFVRAGAQLFKKGIRGCRAISSFTPGKFKIASCALGAGLGAFGGYYANDAIIKNSVTSGTNMLLKSASDRYRRENTPQPVPKDRSTMEDPALHSYHNDDLGNSDYWWGETPSGFGDPPERKQVPDPVDEECLAKDPSIGFLDPEERLKRCEDLSNECTKLADLDYLGENGRKNIELAASLIGEEHKETFETFLFVVEWIRNYEKDSANPGDCAQTLTGYNNSQYCIQRKLDVDIESIKKKLKYFLPNYDMCVDVNLQRGL